MSALLVDDLIVPLPTRSQAGAWRHVEHAEHPRPHLVAVPDVAKERVTPATGATAPLRLTDRGIAVIVVFFLALVATAAVVLVTSFLSVSNDPVVAPGSPVALAVSGG